MNFIGLEKKIVLPILVVNLMVQDLVSEVKRLIQVLVNLDLLILLQLILLHHLQIQITKNTVLSRVIIWIN